MDSSAARTGWFHAGSLLLILFGVAHAFGHYYFFGDAQATSAQALGRQAMLAATIETGGLVSTRWDLFLFFSLTLSLAAVLFPLQGLVALRAAGHSPPVARGLALGGLGFAAGLAILGVAFRILQPIAAGIPAAICYGLAFLRTRPRA
ncbi:MAG: hypothetical protein IT458_08070 [Planctomycetes bacterium]|nr:hypothetical protein [Planctomycetota bacterium]